MIIYDADFPLIVSHVIDIYKTMCIHLSLAQKKYLALPDQIGHSFVGCTQK